MTPAQGLKSGSQETAERDLLLQSLRPSRIGGDGRGLCACEETTGGSKQGLRRTPLTGHEGPWTLPAGTQVSFVSLTQTCSKSQGEEATGKGSDPKLLPTLSSQGELFTPRNKFGIHPQVGWPPARKLVGGCSWVPARIAVLAPGPAARGGCRERARRWGAWECPSCGPVKARRRQAPRGVPDVVVDAELQPEAVPGPEPGWSAHSRLGWSVCPGQSERSPVSAEPWWSGLCLGWDLGSPTQCPSSTGTTRSGPEGPEHRQCVRWGLSERQGPGEATGNGVGGGREVTNFRASPA